MLYLLTECHEEKIHDEITVIGVYTSKEKAEAAIKAIIKEGKERAESYNKQYAYDYCRICIKSKNGCDECLYKFEEYPNGYIIIDGILEDSYLLYIEEIELDQRIN